LLFALKIVATSFFTVGWNGHGFLGDRVENKAKKKNPQVLKTCGF